MTDVLALDVYRQRLRAGDLPAEAAVRKQFCGEVKAESGGRAYTWTISTGGIDRDRDRITVAGWQVDNFLRAGGPVLYAHMSRDLPIGKAPWVRAQGEQLKARVEFAPADVYPFAETVRRLVDFGALKASSVGFRALPGRAAWNEERNGIDFLEQELLEFSIVPVPSNPEALLDAKAAGIDVAPLREWAERVLDSAAGPGLWVPKDQAEAAFRVLAEPRVAGFNPQAVIDALEKRGRVLSAENEARVRSARDAGEAVCAALDEVLASMPEEPMMPEEPKGILTLTTEPTFHVDPALVAACVQRAVSETVREQINEARGRLD